MTSLEKRLIQRDCVFSTYMHRFPKWQRELWVLKRGQDFFRVLLIFLELLRFIRRQRRVLRIRRKQHLASEESLPRGAYRLELANPFSTGSCGPRKIQMHRRKSSPKL